MNSGQFCNVAEAGAWRVVAGGLVAQEAHCSPTLREDYGAGVYVLSSVVAGEENRHDFCTDVATEMTWARRFRRRENVLESLWLVPVIGGVLGGILGIAVSVADEHIGTPPVWQYSPSTATTLLSAIVGATAALTGFIVFLDRFIRRLRPAAVAADVAQVARSTFTAAVAFADRPDIRWDYGTPRAEPAFVVRASRGGAIQAVDPDGLVEWAQAHRAELVLPRRVGDFVQTGGELVRGYGGVFGGRAATELEGMIALGDERTFDQDPAFALRMMVDIANRALSPAVNDPTTAVQVLEHIGDVLALIGRTDLENRTRPESADRPAAVVMLTPRWEDFVALGLTEIREYGATSVQVTRRLRALLLDLLEAVRPEHRAALEEELRRLDATVAAEWRDSVDLDRASAADCQGIGHPTHSSTSLP